MKIRWKTKLSLSHTRTHTGEKCDSASVMTEFCHLSAVERIRNQVEKEKKYAVDWLWFRGELVNWARCIVQSKPTNDKLLQHSPTHQTHTERNKNKLIKNDSVFQYASCVHRNVHRVLAEIHFEKRLIMETYLEIYCWVFQSVKDSRLSWKGFAKKVSDRLSDFRLFFSRICFVSQIYFVIVARIASVGFAPKTPTNV